MSAGTDVEALAEAMLRWLISQQGAAEIGAVLAVVTGVPGAGALISDAAVMLGQVISALIAQVPAAKMQAIIDAEFAAADAVADAAELAKFGAKQ